MAHDLNDTLTFARVVQEGSFTGAARALRLPKTTVSRKVRELETRLGTQLLKRTTRRLGLTEAGATYFEYAQRIARDMNEAEAAVGQLVGAPRGWLRVTTSYSLMANLIAPLIAEFRGLYPELRIDMILSHERLDMVARDIDVALRMGPLPDSSMHARALTVFPNRVYASPRYLAARGAPSHPRELAAHPTLATRIAQRVDRYAWPMSDGGALTDFEIRPVVVADDPEMLKAPLIAGEGLMMATDMIMRRHIEERSVLPVLHGWTGRKPELSAVFPRGNVQSAKVRALVDFLIARVGASE
jgi:DNA-binding transcriptional LysR family regulator